MNWYRIKTALMGLKRLVELTDEDKQACIDAFKFLQSMQDGEQTDTADETKAVADYYKVLNNMLSVFDLEKLYIPPQLDESQGLYGNQLLVEQAVLKELDLNDSKGSLTQLLNCAERLIRKLVEAKRGRLYSLSAPPCANARNLPRQSSGFTSAMPRLLRFLRRGRRRLVGRS